jgi:hypothetical protein
MPFVLVAETRFRDGDLFQSIVPDYGKGDFLAQIYIASPFGDGKTASKTPESCSHPLPLACV